MTFMRRLVPILVAVLLGACGGDYVEDLMTQGEAMQQRMCACTDLACAQKVSDDIHAWKKGLDEEKIKAAEEKATPEERDTWRKRMKAIGDGLDACGEKWREKGLRKNSEGF